MFQTVSLSIIRSFSLYTRSNAICHTGLLTACEQDQDGTVLILLASCQHNLYHCRVYNEKLLMTDGRTVRNM